MWHAHDGMGWWMVLMGGFWLLFWLSLLLVFVRAVLPHSHHEPHQEHGVDAMEIARRRLARGEITGDQFREISDHLGGHGTGPSSAG